MMFPVQVVGLMAFFFFGQVRFMRKSCMWYVYLCYVSLFGYSLLCWSTAISVFPSLQRRRKEGRKERRKWIWCIRGPAASFAL